MIIGLLGKAGSGKDQTADFLVKHHEFQKVALADEIKRTAMRWYGFSETQLWGPSEERNKPDKRYPRLVRKMNFEKGRVPEAMPELGPLPVLEDVVEYLTPRHALQILGTEVGRLIYPNTWIDLTLRIAKRIVEHGDLYDQQLGLRSGTWVDGVAIKTHRHVVISDCRFQNEVDTIHAAGGYVVKVLRPGAGLSGTASQHRSETEQDSVTGIDLSIMNDGSLEDLKDQAAFLVKHFSK